jgi:IS30 family transposase
MKGGATMAKYKHLSLSERLRIERLLNERASFKEIGRQLGKDCTTIAKEVKKHVDIKRVGSHGKAFNNCSLRLSCVAMYLCEDTRCTKPCRFCGRCHKVCKSYLPEQCPKLAMSPYVCNGCKERNRCVLEKRLYSASLANTQYELQRRLSREGVAITQRELQGLDELISPLLRKGQSLHHIYCTHRDSIHLSEQCVYNYIDSGMLSARNVELPRKVRYRPRRKKREHKVDKGCRVGRNYEDFKAFLAENPDMPVVELDSVEGTKGGNVLLTMHFVESSFMLAFLRKNNTSGSVIRIMEKLYLDLGHELFCRLFPVCLADNGSEFSNPLAIEFNMDGVRRTSFYYCDPSSPHQKGACENNHSLLRRILPKGRPLDDLTQEDVNLAMNHVNSYKRKKLHGLSPFEVFTTFHGLELIEKLGAAFIPPNDIVMLPALLK